MSEAAPRYIHELETRLIGSATRGNAIDDKTGRVLINQFLEFERLQRRADKKDHGSGSVRFGTTMTAPQVTIALADISRRPSRRNSEGLQHGDAGRLGVRAHAIDDTIGGVAEDRARAWAARQSSHVLTDPPAIRQRNSWRVHETDIRLDPRVVRLAAPLVFGTAIRPPLQSMSMPRPVVERPPSRGCSPIRTRGTGGPAARCPGSPFPDPFSPPNAQQSISLSSPPSVTRDRRRPQGLRVRIDFSGDQTGVSDSRISAAPEK